MDSTQFDQLINRDGLTLVDFFAAWCGPCRAMHPIVDRLQETLRGRMELCKVNIDAPELATVIRRYAVRSVPTLLFFRRGEVLWRSSGLMSYERLLDVFHQLEQQVAPQHQPQH